MNVNNNKNSFYINKINVIYNQLNNYITYSLRVIILETDLSNLIFVLDRT